MWSIMRCVGLLLVRPQVWLSEPCSWLVMLLVPPLAAPTVLPAAAAAPQLSLARGLVPCSTQPPQRRGPMPAHRHVACACGPWATAAAGHPDGGAGSEKERERQRARAREEGM